METTLTNRKQVIEAAGAVLWRQGDGGLEIAVVHRPRYDDWTLPKGKLDPGETIPAAAVREVGEETGFGCVLGGFHTVTSYPLPRKNGERPVKRVRYFGAHATGGEFTPNDEVDQLRWLPPAGARGLLSYDSDAGVLDEFAALGTGLTTVLLVRHAKAGKRESWEGDDDLRPLSESGLRQAAALRRLLPLFGPDRVHASPRLRCVQTVRPVAQDLGTEIVHEPALSEEGYLADPGAGLTRLLALAEEGGTPLVSSQGAVIPDVVETLARRDGVPVSAVQAKKGSVWVLSFTRDGQETGPRLAAAHYLPSAMPAPD